MALTFPGAEFFVESIHTAMRQIVPAIPPCIYVWDEPAGDFGIAHAYGLEPDNKDTGQLSFDNDRIPAAYTVRHELGHLVDASVCAERGGDPFTNGLYDEFWSVRGFPDTPMDWQLKAIALNNAGNYAAAYKLWPMESFADTFGLCYTPYAWPITDQHGIWLDQDKLRTFYQNLKGLNAMTQDDIDKAVAASMAAFGLDANTFKFIKDRLAADAHHRHGVTVSAGSLSGTTSEPGVM